MPLAARRLRLRPCGAGPPEVWAGLWFWLGRLAALVLGPAVHRAHVTVVLTSVPCRALQALRDAAWFARRRLMLRHHSRNVTRRRSTRRGERRCSRRILHGPHCQCVLPWLLHRPPGPLLRIAPISASESNSRLPQANYAAKSEPGPCPSRRARRVSPMFLKQFYRWNSRPSPWVAFGSGAGRSVQVDGASGSTARRPLCAGGRRWLAFCYRGLSGRVLVVPCHSQRHGEPAAACSCQIRATARRIE